MTKYLTKKRVRHIQSIKLYNVALLLNKQLQHSINYEIIKNIKCFFSIEVRPGDILYISEIQSSFQSYVQFNEVFLEGVASTLFNIKFYLNMPSSILYYKNNETWIEIASYTINMNQLVDFDSRVSKITDFNIPTFELIDGIYIDPKHRPKSNIINTSSIDVKLPLSKTKMSCSYNTLLKLHKLLDYKGQTEEEILEITSALECSLQLSYATDKGYNRKGKIYLKQLESVIESKKDKIDRLRELLTRHNPPNLTSTNLEKSMSKDEFTTKYSSTIQLKDHLYLVRGRKLKQLIAIFQLTGIFSNSQPFITYENNTDYEKSIELNPVDLDVLLSSKAMEQEDSRNSLNTLLGYYLLFIQILGTRLFKVSLPYELNYYGSTSLIDNKYPFYISDSPSIKYIDHLKCAVKCFNRDVQQVSQQLRQQL